MRADRLSLKAWVIVMLSVAGIGESNSTENFVPSSIRVPKADRIFRQDLGDGSYPRGGRSVLEELRINLAHVMQILGVHSGTSDVELEGGD